MDELSDNQKSQLATQKKKLLETMEVDRQALNQMSCVAAPIIVGFALRSLLYEQHFSWCVCVLLAARCNCSALRRVSGPQVLVVDHEPRWRGVHVRIRTDDSAAVHQSPPQICLSPAVEVRARARFSRAFTNVA
jgi:hypothetical protein